MNILNWKNKHKSLDLQNQTLSYIDTEIGNKVIFIIHGYGSSSFDYHKVIDKLKDNYRVIIPDLIGFGLSSKPDKFYFSFLDQALILNELMEKLDINEVSFISHGLGSSILCEILSLQNSKYLNLKIEKIILLDSSLSVEMSNNLKKQEAMQNEMSSYYLKIASSFEMYKKYVKQSFYDDTAVSEDEFNTNWKLLNLKNGAKCLDFVNYAMLECQNFGKKWLENLKSYNHNIHLVMGKHNLLDEFVSCFTNENLVNTDQIILEENCGHYVMLEKPNSFVDHIKSIIW